MQKIMLRWLALVMNKRGISLLQNALDVGLDTDGKEVGEHFKTLLSTSACLRNNYFMPCRYFS